MPPPAIERSVWSAIGSSSRANRNSMTEACGNFGGPPQPPLTLSKPWRRTATASSSDAQLVRVDGQVEPGSDDARAERACQLGRCERGMGLAGDDDVVA